MPGNENSSGEFQMGYAPGRMNRFFAWIYTSVRMVYLLSTGAVLPLAVVYVKSGGGTVFLYPWIGWLSAFGAMIWTLIYIGLEQYSYPVGLRGAVTVSAGMLFNGWSGYTISDMNIFYGAYQVLVSALCAQFLFLSWISASYCFKKFINTEEGREMKWWYLFFLSAVSISLGFLLISMSEPIIYEFFGEKNSLLMVTSVFFFGYQTFSDGVVLWKGSIFNKNVMASGLRNKLHEKWSAFSALTIISSLLASMVIGLWNVS